jgi:hypothetical protein
MQLPPLDMERCAIFVAYLILTGLLGFMSVDSIAVINSRLHIGDPVSYLKGKTSTNTNTGARQ